MNRNLFLRQYAIVNVCTGHYHSVPNILTPNLKNIYATIKSGVEIKCFLMMQKGLELFLRVLALVQEAFHKIDGHDTNVKN